MRRYRTVIAALTALITTMAIAAPAGASGELDPTFSGDGSVRLPADVPPGDIDVMDVQVRPAPAGRLAVGRHYSHDEAGLVEGLLLTPSGSPLSTFNGGQWRTMTSTMYPGGLAGFWASGGGGIIAAHWGELSRFLAMRELGVLGRLIQSDTVALSPQGPGGNFGGTSVMRLPGGSFRTCYRDVNADQDVLLGLTSPAFQPDPAVGPDGRRPIDAGCDLVGSDTAGHLYFATQVSAQRLEIARTTTSGTLDTAWAVGGRAAVERDGLNIELPARFSGAFPNQKFAFSRAAPALVVLGDGSMVLAARASNQASPNRWNAALVKLTPDGALDPTFGSGGVRTFGPPVDGTSRLHAMTVDAAGRPLVSVVYNYPDGRTRAYLARFTSTGRFDGSFGTSALIQQSNAVGSVWLDAEGRILTAAWSGSTVIVARRVG